MSEELKPCPFCGGKAQNGIRVDPPDTAYRWGVRCADPDCVLKWWHLTQEDASKHWNTRAISTTQMSPTSPKGAENHEELLSHAALLREASHCLADAHSALKDASVALERMGADLHNGDAVKKQICKAIEKINAALGDGE